MALIYLMWKLCMHFYEKQVTKETSKSLNVPTVLDRRNAQGVKSEIPKFKGWAFIRAGGRLNELFLCKRHLMTNHSEQKRNHWLYP